MKYYDLYMNKCNKCKTFKIEDEAQINRANKDNMTYNPRTAEYKQVVMCAISLQSCSAWPCPKS